MSNLDMIRLIKALPKFIVFGVLGYLLAVFVGQRENIVIHEVSPAAACSLEPIDNAVAEKGLVDVADISVAGNGLSSPDAGARLDALFAVWKQGQSARFAKDINEMSISDSDQRIKLLAAMVLNGSSNDKRHDPNEPAPDASMVASSKIQNPEEEIRAALVVDESAAMQENERLAGGVDAVDVVEQVRTMASDKKLKYVKSIADERDDSSITKLNDLILSDDDAVRHTAIDTLIEILGQETGHYGAVKTVLAENAMFLDDGQLSKVKEISSRVKEKRKHVSSEKN